MDAEEFYNIEYAKKKIKEYLKKGKEPEICIKINGNDYMIIPLKDKISFQWIGETSEYYYNNVDELFSSVLINGIILDRDWINIQDVWYY
jgi:glucan-binding YG repeat protein